MNKYLIITFFLFSSCGIIRINENGYRNLKATEIRDIKPYKDFILYSNLAIKQRKYVYEINTDNIKTYFKTKKYTWIHLWSPYCSNDYCQNINYFSSLEDKYISKELGLLLISETYDIETINNIVKENKYNKPIFIFQDSYFGSKIMKNRKKFIREINNNNIKIPKYGFKDYLFKDTVLIYSGNNINKQTIDSIINNS